MHTEALRWAPVRYGGLQELARYQDQLAAVCDVSHGDGVALMVVAGA
ncbi:hypothetical protein [Kribbella pittospori]|nr:hypothetical protein [Kribbella pittospori]